MSIGELMGLTFSKHAEIAGKLGGGGGGGGRLCSRVAGVGRRFCGCARLTLCSYHLVSFFRNTFVSHRGSEGDALFLHSAAAAVRVWRLAVGQQRLLRRLWPQRPGHGRVQGFFFFFRFPRLRCRVSPPPPPLPLPW